MPLPMVHLAIAVRLNETGEGLPSPVFLLGSIAPDAIHMRPNTNESDKKRVHLAKSGVSHQELVRLFQTRYGMDKSKPIGFAGGYVTHLLTDRLWGEAVIDPFRRNVSPNLPEEELRSLYYRETDQIDLDLYRQVPWRTEVWARLAEAEPVDFAPLLTAEEVGQWRDRTLVWYEDPGHDLRIEPVYITQADAQAFIDRAAEEIKRIFADLNSPLHPQA